MKHNELVRKVRGAAKRAGRDWWLVREGGDHEYWMCGATKVAIPRHREVGDRTAVRVLRDLEPELGEDWWKR